MAIKILMNYGAASVLLDVVEDGPHPNPRVGVNIGDHAVVQKRAPSNEQIMAICSDILIRSQEDAIEPELLVEMIEEEVSKCRTRFEKLSGIPDLATKVASYPRPNAPHISVEIGFLTPNKATKLYRAGFYVGSKHYSTSGSAGELLAKELGLTNEHLESTLEIMDSSMGTSIRCLKDCLNKRIVEAYHAGE